MGRGAGAHLAGPQERAELGRAAPGLAAVRREEAGEGMTTRRSLTGRGAQVPGATVPLRGTGRVGRPPGLS
ncbi:hypothetical protein [Candidatus Hecatella orcuttiae]|uniref:hypothetical protein n=1 Tax=Candidatus Hecatella orcuttiae TaxID=1935119 RepID=UPI0028682D9B|nr:hypothetical protein [Candidatus Hecatella orcuttiae]